MAYWQCCYHVIWATRGRMPWITERHEAVLHEVFAAKANALHSHLLAYDGMPDHVHLALQIPPSMAVAEVVGALKGASSRALNVRFPNGERFAWQERYGLLTVSQRGLPALLAYIANQKQHHREATITPGLEQVEGYTAGDPSHSATGAEATG